VRVDDEARGYQPREFDRRPRDNAKNLVHHIFVAVGPGKQRHHALPQERKQRDLGDGFEYDK
jgi:hypothetical protein